MVLDTMLYSARLKERVARENSAVIVAMARLMAETFDGGGRVLFCGNGGSAADAQHLATELTIRYRSSVERPALAAIALSSDSMALTAGANDLGYDAVFARLVEAYGHSGDLLVGISTSGNSQSVLNAFDAARARAMNTLALLGGEGGAMKGKADIEIIVPHSGSADRVQECHIAIGHVIIDLVERMLGYCPPPYNHKHSFPMQIKQIEGDLGAQDARIALVVSRFNDFIGQKLVEGALDCIRRHGGSEENIAIYRCPGAFELPMVAKKVALTGKYDAVVTLGAIIRGSTPHFDVIAAEATKGIAQAALETGIPIAFGVLTTENIEQAIERAGTKAGNKGFDAALTAIEMINLYRAM